MPHFFLRCRVKKGRKRLPAVSPWAEASADPSAGSCRGEVLVGPDWDLLFSLFLNKPGVHQSQHGFLVKITDPHAEEPAQRGGPISKISLSGGQVLPYC